MADILGVDCGDVIFNSITGVPLPSSIDALREFNASPRFEKIYIVSQARFFGRCYFLFHLWRLDFWRRTGISRDSIHFCDRDSDKAPICRKLGVTHFIDDKLDVLQYMKDIKRYAFQPRKKDLEKFADTAAAVAVIGSWEELSKALIG